MTPAPVTVIKASPPCNLPSWPRLVAIDGQSLKYGARVIDASTGQTFDAAPGSAVLPKEALAAIAGYVKATASYYDAAVLCTGGR